MMSSINKDRIEKRGTALLNVYSKYRKAVPSLDTFVNDYFEIVDPAKSNQYLVKQTSIVLKSTYESFTKCHRVKTAITIQV